MEEKSRLVAREYVVFFSGVFLGVAIAFLFVVLPIAVSFVMNGPFAEGDFQGRWAEVFAWALLLNFITGIAVLFPVLVFKKRSLMS